jgi:hypothetical protein
VRIFRIDSSKVYAYGGKHLNERRGIQIARQKTIERGWRHNRVCGYRRNRKPDKQAKNPQKSYYSGKKKRHTIKNQVVINGKSRKIIDGDEGLGHEHGFNLFKRAIGAEMDEDILKKKHITNALRVKGLPLNILMQK